jgi:hypothetical protein
MMYHGIALTNEQIKVRKQWLVATLIIAGITLLSNLVARVEPSTTGAVRSTAEIVFVLLKTLAVSAMGLVPMLLLYIFAYRNPGTKYLTFGLIFAPVKMLGGYVHEFRSLANEAPALDEPLKFITITLLVICIGMDIWAYALGWQLRGVNKQIQFKLTYGSQDYAEAKAAFEQATDEAELTERYHKAIYEKSYRLAKPLKLLYKSHLKRLTTMPQAVLSAV